MFGFDLKSMLSGDGGGMGAGIMKMVLSQLTSPGTQKLINEKIADMADHLATGLNCTRNQIGLFVKIESVPASDEKGVLLLGEDGKQTLVDKAIVYIYVDGEAKQKIAIDEFMKLIAQEHAK